MDKPKTLDEIIWTPGWNGQPYNGNNWIVANSIIPSRKLTPEELDYMESKLKKYCSNKSNIKIIRKDM